MTQLLVEIERVVVRGSIAERMPASELTALVERAVARDLGRFAPQPLPGRSQVAHAVAKGVSNAVSGRTARG